MAGIEELHKCAEKSFIRRNYNRWIMDSSNMEIPSVYSSPELLFGPGAGSRGRTQKADESPDVNPRSNEPRLVARYFWFSR